VRRAAKRGLPLLLAILALAPAGAVEKKTMKPTRPAAGAGAPATVLLPSPASPLVTFRIQFRSGSIDDPAGKEGLNALAALMIGQGGTRDLTFREVTEKLYPMAASVVAQPDREVTTFVGEVHRDHLKPFYGLLVGLLTTPRFDPADLQRNRDLLLAEIESSLRGNDDENLGKAALNQILYEGQPYGRLDIGTVQGLKAITLDDLRAFYRAHYTRGNVLVGLAGGYPAGLAEQMRKDLGVLPEGAPPRAALPKPRTIEGMEVLLVDKPCQATAISIGRPLDVNRGDPDFSALLMAGSWLGEHRTFNGRLMNVMRGDRGLNYGDYAYVESFVQEGGSTFPLTNIPCRQQHFSIWIRPVVPENALFALRQATRELQRLVDKGLSPEDFQKTREHLLNYSRLWAQSLSRRLGMEMDSRFYGTGFFLDRVAEDLPKLTVERVNAAIRGHLNARDLAVAIVTDRAEEVRRALLSGAPTPIAYQVPTTREDLLKEDKEIESYALPINKDRLRIVKAQDLFER
jgi:zinc protease